MKKTVVIYGHPHYKMSVSNKAILEELKKELPEVEIVNLMELYPDYQIDVEREQERLREADSIVFQFPFWWYGWPSLMYRYIEEVCTPGFAYGKNGEALKGKKLIPSYTTGMPEEFKGRGGIMRSEAKEFLPHIADIADVCGLECVEPVASSLMMIVNPDNKEHVASIISKAREHGHKLAETIKNLQ